MEFRRLCREDRDRVLRLWNAAAMHDAMSAALLDEKLWGDEDFDPGLALVAEGDGEVAGFVAGVLRSAADGRRGFIKLLAVAPAERRRGIGSALLDRAERGLAARGAASVRMLESAPNYLVPGIDGRYRDAVAFVEARGYERMGEAFNLRVDLAMRSAAGDEPEGIEVRRAGASDAAPLRQFLDAHWPTWNAEARAALANVPPSLYVATRAGRVVGFAAWDANNRGTGWFGPMGVAPGARGSGIGRVLLWRCLDGIRQQGHDAATIAWADHAPFYERCAGAERARTFIRYEKRL